MLERLYKFSPDFVGDIQLGRPNLGGTTSVEVYRLLQYTLRDVLEERLGSDEADALLRKAGELAGKEFYSMYLEPCSSLNEFVSKAQKKIQELGIGILRVEEAEESRLCFTLAVLEDLDCSGLPMLSHGVCVYDEGFIAGLFEAFTGQPFVVAEVDCWCTGGRACRFDVKPADAADSHA